MPPRATPMCTGDIARDIIFPRRFCGACSIPTCWSRPAGAAVALPQVLLSALRGEIQAIVSVPLPLDYESVLTRPHQLEATGLSIAEANAILDALTGVAEPVHLRFLWWPRLEDPATPVKASKIAFASAIDR